MKEKKEKKQKFNKIKFKKRLSNYLVTFVSIFTIMVCCYVAVSLFVFNQFNIHFYYLVLIAIIASIESLLIELFIRINNISIYGQSSVIYSLCALSCFILVLFINNRLFTSPLFWLISLPGSFIGLIVLTLIIFFIKRNEENTLNENLNRYKEVKHNEK